jgi:HAD superfamily hydrolase (TIGR01549 family)
MAQQTATPERIDSTVPGVPGLPGGPVELVTFDLYDTLIELVPPRWERLATALATLGIAADPAALRSADVAAEDFYTAENGGTPIRDRSRQEQETFRLEYHRRWCAAAGIPLDDAQVAEVRRAYRAEMETEARWHTYRVFDDVLPAARRLQEAGVKRAIISNADADVTEFVTHLAIYDAMDAVITSAVVGWEKPDPRTYHAALEHPAIAVEPGASLHAGDQPRSDVIGARQVGMRSALIDRYERQPADLGRYEPDIRVTSLLDLAETVVTHNAAVRG